MKILVCVFFMMNLIQISLNGQNENWFKKGEDAKTPNDKIFFYTRQIEKDGGNSAVYNNRGNAKFNLKDYAGAILDFSKAIQLDPKLVVAYFNRGNARLNLKEYQSAIIDYSKAIELNSKDPKALINRGLAKYYLKDYRGSIADYNKVLGLDSKNSSGYLNRGLAKYSLNDNQGAISDCIKAIGLDPQNAIIYNNLGYFYMTNGDYGNAIIQFQKCLKINNKYFDASLGLAMTYYNKKDKITAKKYLTVAQSIEHKLYKGMTGIAEMEKTGYTISDKKRETLKKMFEDLK